MTSSIVMPAYSNRWFNRLLFVGITAALLWAGVR